MAKRAARKRLSTNEVTEPHPTGPRLLSRSEVLERVSVTYPTLWRWMQAGKFPRAKDLNGRLIGWLESDIEAWISALPVKQLKVDRDQRGR